MVGADGISRVIDFGIAKAIGRSRHTQDGAARGKIAYMAAEQLEGAASQSSDIFVSAVVLWEMLASRRYYDNAGPQEIVHAVLNASPKSLRAIHADIPPAIDGTLLRAR